MNYMFKNIISYVTPGESQPPDIDDLSKQLKDLVKTYDDSCKAFLILAKKNIERHKAARNELCKQMIKWKQILIETHISRANACLELNLA